MSHNKSEYWKRRKEGLRGQGEKPKPISFEESPGKHVVNVGNTFQRVNRKTARKKLPDDPRYTKVARPSKSKEDHKAIQERVKRQEAVRQRHAKPKIKGPPHPLSRGAA